MTICEKFKLMMASFADIKAAIAEKGGTVTGGYADYAKNIRNLYSNDTYTSQYQYPTEKSPIMQYLINLYNRITFCYAVKQEIRQAINCTGRKSTVLLETNLGFQYSRYHNDIRRNYIRNTNANRRL